MTNLIKAKYNGKCVKCGEPIFEGDLIFWYEHLRYYCFRCGSKSRKKFSLVKTSSIKNKVFDTDHLTEIKTPIFKGVKEITIVLESFTPNPYRGMCDMALATWGSQIRKWDILTPEERFYVVLKVLQNKALPLGRESPSFLFSISGVSRSSFDQIARQRIGSTFSSLGWNNIHTQTGFRIPNEILDHEEHDEFEYLLEDCVDRCKEVYSILIGNGISYQSAREILPIGMLHWFHFNITYEALRQFCSRRLCFSEKEDTVATAWLMRERVKEKFPLLTLFLRPSCDWSKKCGYHSEDSLPEEMGTLFESCGRNPSLIKEPNVDFHRPSTKVSDLERDLNIKIPTFNDEFSVNNFDDLSDIDKELFSK